MSARSPCTATRPAPSADTTLVAQWRVVVEVAFSKGDGTGGDNGIIYDSEAGGFCRIGGSGLIDSVAVPRLKCFSFLGYYTAASGGTQLIDADGTLLPALIALAADVPATLYAQWQRVSYALALDHEGGAGGNDEIFCDGTNAVCHFDRVLQFCFNIPRRIHGREIA